MADVFLARDDAPRALARHVVVKRIFPHLARDGQYIGMLLEEARLAALLRHTNIVQVHEAGEHDGQYYIAMEHLHGHDVARLGMRLAATTRRMPLEQILHIVISVCAGLHHAHELRDSDGSPMGVVHRDVSPHNVFVTYDGHVKLVDFGIAKAAFRAHHTQTGVIRGKVGYLAPEQALAQPVDRRADVFSLSVILWELVTGTRLFPGDDPFVTMRKVVENDAPPPSSVRPDVHPSFDRILARGLARDREARYPTARALAEDLESLAREAGAVLSQRTLAELVTELCPEDADLASIVQVSHAGAPRLANVESATSDQSPLSIEPAAVSRQGPRTRLFIAAGVAAAAVLLGLWGFVTSHSSAAAAPAAVATVSVPIEIPAVPAAAPVHAKTAEPAVPEPHVAKVKVGSAGRAPRKQVKARQSERGVHPVEPSTPTTGAATPEDRNAPVLP
jgi:serine/threonine protein kinase